ncbi:Hypothetical protein LEPBI_I3159 [Leptospira biflexa serovar Patoc strain 'Patoc 1 (Paris)']|uniref:Uncharacterized protein n=1 Tax=Leptospira biflexa serovar Patoc (strain Patoc 1 / ATCC 23582 / Paris) TaxID=456481 RepID=B0SQ72_LEPBP|nr:Hypothetical protein LEPBI_I3159 [Leptospira biflexa serovar Patoc strain 'Patoc 1 (Paris)']
MVKEHGYFYRKQKATLKGVGTPVPVFQLSRNQLKQPSKWKSLFLKN